ncbi:MAG: DUF2489 domain-containing protein [Spongiibacteraceae bacterium]
MTIYFAIFAVLGVAVIMVLGWLAWRDMARLRAQQRDEAAAQTKLLGKARQNIHILASSLLAQQVELAEAALRLAAVLDQPCVPELEKLQGSVFVELAAKLAHIPTHQQWAVLASEQRAKFRDEMSALEQEYQPRALLAAEQLLARH